MKQFIDEDRKKHIELIKSFCKGDSQNGGILLISGARGVGKTRLIDEALVDDQKYTIGSRIRNFLGLGSRPREIAKRGPRRSKRFLFRVNVDPFFPFAEKYNSESLNLSEKNEVTMMLLRNIIFALTSNIDPRLSWKAHGRVLHQRLGLSFWFSPSTVTGLTKCFLWGVLLSLFILLMTFVNQVLINCFLIDYSWLVLFFGIFLALYIVFRWSDWSALNNIGRDLYDLAHAQEIKRTNDILAQNLDAAVHPVGSFSLSGILALIIGVGISFIVIYPEYFDFINKLGFLPSLIEKYKHFIAWFSTLSGLAIFGFTASLNASSRRHIARYGNKNPAWMVTLLRRYLFIAHRCGIEPILIFDELDKLENNSSCLLNESSQIEGQQDNEKLSPMLVQFLDALLRVRDSSGAGFLMVLVSGSQFHYQLRHVRQRTLFNSISMAPTGTLIQQELCVGSISKTTALKYFKNFEASAKSLGRTFNIQYASYFWILSHGLFANYLRLTEQYFSGTFNNLSSQQLERASKLSDYLDAFWDLKVAWRIGQMNFRESEDDILNHRMKDEFWYRCFIHTGMLQYCHALLEGIEGNEKLIVNSAKTKILEMLKLENENSLDTHFKTSLVVGSPVMLRLLGHQLMYLMLTQIRALDLAPNKEVILKAKLTESGLRRETVNNVNKQQQILQSFQSEFEFKKKEFVMLVVHLDSPSENWIVAGFNDNGEFTQELVDASNNELFEKLKKEPEDERELVKLIASKLGRTYVE